MPTAQADLIDFSEAASERGRRRQTPVSIGSRHGLLIATGEAGRDHAGRMLVQARWNNVLAGVTRSCGCRKRAGTAHPTNTTSTR